MMVREPMTREEFKKTNWKMSYEEYKACYCPTCLLKETCKHNEAYRRVPEIDSGLGLCPNLKEVWKYNVPDEVKDNIILYLKQNKESGNDLGYLCDIFRKSEFPEDNYLYMVITVKRGKYNCWTCWNESTQSLNHGHWGLESYEESKEICNEFFTYK